MRSRFLKEIFEDVCVWTQLPWKAMQLLYSLGYRGIKTIGVMRIAKFNGGGMGAKSNGL